jgi:hypothetical protein
MAREIVLDNIQQIDELIGAEIFDRPVNIEVHETCPYKFEAKTVGEMIDFLSESRRYGSDLFSWNVKAYSYNVNGDDSDYKRNPDLDKAWSKFLDSREGQYVHESAFEQAQEYYRHDWCAYPGDDQGDWEFAFYGRSGGHLTLTKWKGYSIERLDRDSYLELLAGLLHDYLTAGNHDIVKLYMGIVCADQEFTPENASKNVTYHYGALRHDWEERRANILPEMVSVAERAVNKLAAAYGFELTTDVLKEFNAKVFEDELKKGVATA